VRLGYRQKQQIRINSRNLNSNPGSVGSLLVEVGRLGGGLRSLSTVQFRLVLSCIDYMIAQLV